MGLAMEWWDWLRDSQSGNPEGVQAITAAFQAGAAIFGLVATVFLLVITRRTLQTALEQSRLAVQQLNIAARPYIAFQVTNFQVMPSRSPSYEFKVEIINFGMGPALDLLVDVTPKMLPQDFTFRSRVTDVAIP